ncbi:uncharacterized protein LOC114541859 isoform X3 [Dendronephthya gigantea]|uniref:uncharacterized protein LOC114541859 isoform X3 n=1 Tax=Dendronephthya gigantea TaxID=151771 RepID=UPI00106D6FA2|nr:uncharacterized protein LOC114541859 isoform X3 [Dendronephthya gigantea]
MERPTPKLQQQQAATVQKERAGKTATKVNDVIAKLQTYKQQHSSTNPLQNQRGPGNRASHSSKLAHTDLVPSVVENADTTSGFTTKGPINLNITKPARDSTSSSPNSDTNDMPLVRAVITNQGISQETCELIMSSWKVGTRRQYGSYLRKWSKFCHQRGIDPISPPLAEGLEFLRQLFDGGLGYSAINTARSALASVITLPGGTSFGSHLLVCRLVKGVYTKRPSLPKYNGIWDVNLVLSYLSTIPLPDISLKNCSYKLIMLLALLSGQRCQTLHALTLADGMVLSSTKCVFTVKSLLKTSKPTSHLVTYFSILFCLMSDDFKPFQARRLNFSRSKIFGVVKIVVIFLVFADNAVQCFKLDQLCSSNGRNSIRECDSQGCGDFGTPRVLVHTMMST